MLNPRELAVGTGVEIILSFRATPCQEIWARELFSRRVVVPESVLVRELSGEAVLLNLGSGMYFGLEEIGYRMWTVLTTSECIGVAYEQLSTEYEVSPRNYGKVWSANWSVYRAGLAPACAAKVVSRLTLKNNKWASGS